MKRALIRFEDVGPGGYYESPENRAKLCAIADYLHAEGVPFHVAMIPRFVNPATGYDKSIADHHDPLVQDFHKMIEHLRQCGGSIGMHGYRHQYGQAVTADGFEFAYADCTADCPPDDRAEAYLERAAFERSYASSRMRDGFAAVQQSGLQIDWFETPHYTASENQRWILESWVGLFFENDPHATDNNRVSIRDVDTPLFRGVVYVPTPLYYVDGSKPDEEVERMLSAIKDFTEADIAAFFFHPFLDFPFLHGKQYEEHSYLKRLIRGFKQQGYTFVHLLSLVQFVPSSRTTNLFPGNDFVVMTGDVNGDGCSELIAWERSSGDVYIANVQLDHFPSRQNGQIQPALALKNWVQGDGWQLFVGDFNGDGKDDLAAWHASSGTWQFAWSEGGRFQPASARMTLQGFGVGEQWTPLVGDFNGDGRDELAIWKKVTGEFYVLEELLQGRQVRRWFLDERIRAPDIVVCAGDFNADGTTDLVLWQPHDGSWQVLLSNGKQLVRAVHPPLTGWAVGTHWQPLVGDFDGDGRDDILVVDPVHGDWQVARSTGAYFTPLSGVLNPWAAGAYMEPLIGVFTSDGRTSICARNGWLRGGTVDFAVSVIGNGLPSKTNSRTIIAFRI